VHEKIEIEPTNKFKLIKTQMKKNILRLFSVFAMSAIAFNASAQFEGVIEFTKKSATDTTSYVYYVKGNTVKIDEIGARSKKVEGSFIVNMDNKTLTMLNHDRKIYMDQAIPATPVTKGKPEVKKGDGSKTIQGYKCQEYSVTNTEENTKITYWLAQDKFTFFEKLLRQLNRKDKSSVYYLLLPDIKNAFPMMSTQTDLTGKPMVTLEVTKITKKEIDATMFQIPKGYNKFEK
jgi:hypothetical protein